VRPGRRVAAPLVLVTLLALSACEQGGDGVDAPIGPDDAAVAGDALPEPQDAPVEVDVLEPADASAEVDAVEPPDAAAADVAVPAFVCPRARTTDDAPDDEPDRYQVRALYVLPSDGADEQLDTDDRICRSLQAATHWLSARTGGPRLRLDTAGATLDIGFVRLEKSDAVMRGSGGRSIEDGYAYLRDRIERELVRMNLVRPQKIYAVYYGGSSPFSCGGGAWPPNLPGKVAALYLHGEPPGASPCRSNPIGASVTRPGYVEYSMVHEVLHTLGIVADGAPNEHAAGHVFDPGVSPAMAAQDLMYAQRSGADPGWGTRDPDGLQLDIARDDYYGHGRPDQADLARSVFLTPLPPDAQLPPRW
jgi:hypothetical protein